jgi:hypothetical protein
MITITITTTTIIITIIIIISQSLTIRICINIEIKAPIIMKDELVTKKESSHVERKENLVSPTLG